MCIKIQTQFWFRKPTVGHPPCPVHLLIHTVPHNKETATPCGRVQNSLTSRDRTDWALFYLLLYSRVVLDQCGHENWGITQKLTFHSVAFNTGQDGRFIRFHEAENVKTLLFVFIIFLMMFKGVCIFSSKRFRFRANTAKTIVYFRLSW